MVGRKNIVPQRTAMYDEVYVNKKLVTDYNIGLPQAKPLDELIAKIKEKFPNEYDFYSNEI